MHYFNPAKAIILLAVILPLHGCGLSQLSQTSRYAFSPPLSELLAANTALKPGKPIAERYSYGWQNVEQELAESMDNKEKKTIVSSYQGPGLEASIEQSRKLATDASQRMRENQRLAQIASNSGDASYHRDMARLSADQALLHEQMAVAGGQMNAAIGVVDAVFGIYGALAAAGKAINDKNYGILSDNTIRDLNLAGNGARENSRLHFNYHFGLEPSKSKQFDSGMAMFFGGNTEANNEFIVTAVLTLPDGRRISSTRLVKMIWYAGSDNFARPFPEGYEEFKLAALPKVEGMDSFQLNTAVLSQMTLAAADDLRRKLNSK